MPEPGQDRLGVRELHRPGRCATSRREHVYVLLDFHQDGYGPGLGDNGFPAWMQITDGLPNPDVGFPAYYVANPALQRAFENFYANRPGPGGHRAAGLLRAGPARDRLALRLRPARARLRADERALAGRRLGRLLRRHRLPGARAGAAAALLRQGHRGGEADHPPPARCSSSPSRPSTSEADPRAFRAPALATPWPPTPTRARPRPRCGSATSRSPRRSATTPRCWSPSSEPPATRCRLRRLLDGFDARGVSWAFWAYNENLITDRTRPASLEALRSPAAFRALVQPYPQALDRHARQRPLRRRHPGLHPQLLHHRPAPAPLPVGPRVGGVGAEAPVPGRVHREGRRGADHLAAVRRPARRSAPGRGLAA